MKTLPASVHRRETTRKMHGNVCPCDSITPTRYPSFSHQQLQRKTLERKKVDTVLGAEYINHSRSFLSTQTPFLDYVRLPYRDRGRENLPSVGKHFAYIIRIK